MEPANKFLQQIFDHSGIAIIIVDKDGLLIHFNKYFKNLANIPNPNLLNKKKIFDFFSTQQRDQLKHLFEKVIKPSETDQLFLKDEFEFIDGNNHHHVVILTITNIPQEDNLIVTLNAVNSIRKKQRLKILEQQQKYISEMASGIGHEIRNPLSAINTSVEILQESLELSGQNEELMNIILEEVSRLNEIVRSFLRFTKMPAPNFKQVNINELIENLAHQVRGETGSQIEIDLDLQKNLPFIKGDYDQLSEVVAQLLNNAMEACSDGGRVDVKTSQIINLYNEKQLQITLSDTGVGMGDEELDHIVRPFFTNKEDKMGMGLTSAERIIYNHGGTIDFKSERGKGTIVTICLPFDLH